jgi:MFS family permease
VTRIGVVAAGAAALAAGMGVGRFVYTPILPLMHSQAGLSASGGADLATANYVGYLVGALAGIAVPRLVRSVGVLRGALVVLIGTLGGMAATHGYAPWAALRLVAGVASALIFVIAVSSLQGNLPGSAAHLAGWALGGVGAGIALSGSVVLVLRTVAGWQAAWEGSAMLAAVLAAACWNLSVERDEGGGGAGVARTDGPALRRFAALFASYSLEGVGYIVAGTFLVAAVGQASPGWIAGGAWVLVGLAAVPSAALWAWLGRRRSRGGLLIAALLVQAVGIALPALVGGTAAALVSALLFGGTFLGVAAIALAVGRELHVPHAVALLTAGYSAGQILGPIIVTPLIHHGYHKALIVAAAVVLASAAAAVPLRARASELRYEAA